VTDETAENPLRDAIAGAIAEKDVLLFMKGTPEQPMCGFSARTVAALEAHKAAFFAVDVLPDPRIRQELSAISNWPTIPQLFVKGELVGGCDIITELADGGQLLVAPGFLPADAADRALCELRDRCAWEQRPALFGHPQPRLTAAHGDAGLTYRYSSTVHQAAPWTATLRALKAAIEGVMGRYNFCLLNRYRSGADSMGLHADDEPEMGDTIGSLSLGATRTFRIRHNVTRESRAFPIEHGTLIIMAGSMQRFWKHEIPKTARPVGERINLTFREIRPVELAPRPATPD
jgi:Grx4 family monothiol glutaredoxin